MKSVGQKNVPRKIFVYLWNLWDKIFIGFHGWIRGRLAYRITHGFARIFGRWPMAHARYVLLLFLVTQISQMTQIFLGRVLSHRFHRYTQIFYGISSESLCPIPGGICNDRTGRLCEIPCRPMIKKICVICEICVTKKRPKKNLCISVKSVGHFPISGGIFSSWDYFYPTDFTDLHRFFWNLRRIALSDPRGYLQRPNRSPLRNSVSNRRSRKSPNKFRFIRWIKSPIKNLCHLRNLRD